MLRLACLAAIGIGLVVVSSMQGQVGWREACVDRCYSSPSNADDPELERQEIVNLEREAARAIQLSDGTFFRRVYSDEFAATLSHGQAVNKTQWIGTIEASPLKYDTFQASDIKVRVFQNTAIATCLWSARLTVKGKQVYSQMRAIHVYINTQNGWRVISGQNTNLPPDVQQPL
jgi:ketosteroid isomerase-like protein